MQTRINLNALLIVSIYILTIASTVNARIIYVDDDGPADFNNIQPAINAAGTGDTVLVADGIYKGSENRYIDFTGKEITVQSENGPANCIVDCEGFGRGFYLHRVETAKSIVNGFTVTNGAGILIERSSPTITNCIITKNSIGFLLANGSNPTITSCIITKNSSGFHIYNWSSPVIKNSIISENSGNVAGMYCHTLCHPTIINCVFINNSDNSYMGGLLFGYATSFTIRNCTITGNSAVEGGGGVVYSDPGTITNSIIWGNTEPQVSGWGSSRPAIQVSYSNVEGGYPGIGNMDIDPLMMSDGYHIQLNSPCLNSGDPGYSSLPGETDIDGEPRIINNRVDIGADEQNYEGPVITLSPRHLNIFYGIGAQNPEPHNLHINNSGAGIINWIISNNCDWLDVWPTSGRSSDDVNEVKLSIDAIGLEAGKYSCELMVSDPNVINTPQYMTVNLEVRKPVIAVDPTVLNFECSFGGPNPETQKLSVWNDDIGILNWQVSEDCNWLDISPGSGKSAGEVNEVVISVNAEELNGGEHTCVLTVFDPNALNTPQEVTVNLNVRTPLIGISPAQLEFYSPLAGPDPEPQTLSIRNDGIGLLNWQLIEDCNWLSAWPTSGRSSGEVNEVVVTVEVAGLEAGVYTSVLTVLDPIATNSPQHVTIKLDVRKPVISVTPAQFKFICPEGGPDPEPQMLSIWNDDIGTLNWQITVDCNWLYAVPNEGNSTGEINEVMIHVDASGLIPGLHSCTLTITDPTAQNNPKVVPITLFVCGDTLHVPGDFPTIQDAIDHALEGGTVIVAEGTYTGPGNRDIDFKGKAITVRSIDPDDPNIVAATVIDCNATETEHHRGFYFHNEEEANSIIAGFTITNGHVFFGGGIFCEGSSPTITNCIIFGNVSSEGGGICCRFPSSAPPPPPKPPSGQLLPPPPPPPPPPVEDYNSPVPTITNCIISENISYCGGGICYKDMRPIITNCIITNNIASDGGGIYCRGQLVKPPPPPPPPPPPGADEAQSSIEVLSDYNSVGPMIANCTVTANLAKNAGGAVYSANYSCPVLINNCILWENRAPLGSEIALVSEDSAESAATVSHCDVQGGQTDIHIGDNCILYWGQGNIDSDPCFVEPGDSALISYWKFDDVGGTTAYDSVGRNHGTVHGAQWTGGQVGSALDFDGINDYIDMADTVKNYLGINYTVSVWIKTNTVSAGYAFSIIAYRHSTKINPVLFALGQYNKHIHFAVRDNSLNLAQPVYINALTTNSWYHIAGVREENVLNVYVNGVSGIPDSEAFGYIGPDNLKIGAILFGGNPHTNYFNGTIDEVKIFNRALSTGEIQQDYFNGLNGKTYPDANTPDYHLLTGSPCIDAGDSNNIPLDLADLDGDGDVIEPIPFDLDGHSRVTDGDNDGISVVDMGAYELNHIPVADAGPDQIVECACNTAEGTKVALDGSASYDADGDPLTFTWTGPFVESPANGATPTVTLETGCPADYVITLVVNDGTEDSKPDDVTITVVDTTPPDFELSVSPKMLWPPDHKMVLITPSWTVSDKCDTSPDVSLVGIVANEGDNTIGDGHTSDDIQIGEDGSIYLRSERSGTGNDRIYTITYQAVDDCGNTTVRSATVSIPHDFKVLARIASRWLWSGPAGRIPEDLNGDGIVNLADVARFAGNWTK